MREKRLKKRSPTFSWRHTNEASKSIVHRSRTLFQMRWRNTKKHLRNSAARRASVRSLVWITLRFLKHKSAAIFLLRTFMNG